MILELAPAGPPPSAPRGGVLASQQARQPGARELELSIPGLLYVLLALSGWLATTLLSAAGVFVVLFWAAGNGTMPGFFEQLELLARHYQAAAPLRRDLFDSQLLFAAALVFTATGFFRRGALIAVFLGGTDGPTVAR